jgi:hypothetical protein
VSRGGRRTWLLLLLLVAVVNLPLLHSTWTERRVERSDIVVTATEVQARATDSGEHWVAFRFPDAVDPEQQTWSAQVDEATYDEAQRTGELKVRVLEDNPAAYQVEGAVDSSFTLVATLVADAVLLLLILLLWRRGGLRRGPLRAVALEDVQRCPPGMLLEQLQDEEYLIRGDVLERDRDRVVLDLGDRSVEVRLDGHENPVGYQQSAQVRARLI